MGKYEQLLPNTKKIIDFICDVKYEDIPKKVIGNAKSRILDCIGVGYAGGIEAVGKKTKSFLLAFCEAQNGCTVIGTNMKTDVLNAAMANAILMDATDYNDYFLLSHPSVGVVPSILTVGEMVGASGKELLTAYVVGMEIYTKINQAMNTEPWKNGFHASGIFSTLSSVAAAGKLLHLNREQMLMAWGIACSSFNGVKANMVSNTKPYHIGRSVEGGVRSALLASLGFTSHVDAFEGKEGYMDVFCSDIRWEYIQQLGIEWDLIERPAGIKPHPACGTTNAPMEGMMELATKYDLNEKNVERIDIGLTSGVNFDMHIEAPKNIDESKVSIHYCVAMVLRYRDWGPRYLSDDIINLPEMRELYSKIHLYLDKELDKVIPKEYADCHAIVTVTLKDGTRYSVRAEPPVFSYEQVISKFYDSSCNINLISKEHCDRIAEVIRHLERVDIGDLMELLA